MKHQILFVDDEARILEGLKRMLRPMRHEWEMAFANGGQEALTFLEQTPVTVVVSDVRMPIMNGVQLLTEVRRLYPHTIRILLSGQSDEEMTLTAIGPVHQYLSKPCEADVLKSTIARACALGELLTDENVRRFVSQVESLPALPQLYLEVKQELQSSDCSLEKVASIIGKDVGMTAQILKLVNSAFFGSQQHMSDLKQAVMFLGTETLCSLVLGLKVFEEMGPKQCASFNLDQLCQHSLETGDLARKIMRTEKADKTLIEEAFTAAMLHDVGMLLLVSCFPDRYQECLRIGQEQNISLHEAEREVLGTTHAEVGAYLLGLWGLTTPIVEAVAFHHTPLGSPNTQLSPLTAVHVANLLVSNRSDGVLEEAMTKTITEAYLDRIGLSDRLANWQALLEVPV